MGMTAQDRILPSLLYAWGLSAPTSSEVRLTTGCTEGQVLAPS